MRMIYAPQCSAGTRKSVADMGSCCQAIYGSGGAAPGADAAAGGTGGADAGPKGGDDNVVDAEFTDTDK